MEVISRANRRKEKVTFYIKYKILHERAAPR